MELQPLSHADVKSWNKMAIQLVMRTWLSWLAFIAVYFCISLCILSVWTGDVGIGKFIIMIYEMIIPVFMFEVAMVIALKADKQFGWRQFMAQLSAAYSSPNVYRFHGWWIVFNCLIMKTLLFNVTYSPVVRFQQAVESGGMTGGIIVASAYMAGTVLGVVFLSALSVGGSIQHHIQVACQHDPRVAKAYRFKADKQYANLGVPLLVVPVFAIMAFYFSSYLIIPVIAAPFFFVWRYVAAREALFGGGNTAKQAKRQEVDNIAIIRAGA